MNWLSSRTSTEFQVGFYRSAGNPSSAPYGLGLHRAAFVRHDGLAERLEQRAVHGIALRVVLRVPLNAECEAGGVGDADRLDRAVVRQALDDDALAWFQNALTVERVHTNGFAAHQRGKGAAFDEMDVVTVAEDHRVIGMDLTR